LQRPLTSTQAFSVHGVLSALQFLFITGERFSQLSRSFVVEAVLAEAPLQHSSC
jgi:hypothetical protein